MSITLYGGGPGFGLPEISPYATKTEVQLQLAGLAYRKAFGRPDQSPKGQLPWIVDGDEAVADSTFIRAHIERKFGVDLDAGLSAAERSQAWALERMIENQLGWIAAYFRFLVPANFAKGPAHWFDAAPAAARESLKRGLLEQVGINLKAVGITRHREDEILVLGQKSLAALSTLLDGRPYLFGRRPSGVDATAFGALAGIMTPFFDSPLRDSALRHDNLVDYVVRMMAVHYPDHPWSALSETQTARAEPAVSVE